MNILILILILLIIIVLVLQLIITVQYLGIYPFTRESKIPRLKFTGLDSPDKHEKKETGGCKAVSGWNDVFEISWQKELSNTKDPATVLEKAIGEYLRDPVAKNMILLVRLANHINNRIRYDDNIDSLIEKISGMIKKVDNSLIAHVRLFEHTSVSGRQLFVAHPGKERYLLAGREYLNQYEFNDITSSVSLCADPAGPPQTCLIFENDRFDGKFRAFSFNENRSIISLPYFNDLVSSLILVSHDPSGKYILKSIRELAGERINLTVERLLKTFHGFSLNGDVLVKFTIDAFEIGHAGKALIGIEIPLLFHAFYPLKKTSVTLCFYTELFVTTNHQLKAGVVGWHYLIEPGVLTYVLEKKLQRQAPVLIHYLESTVSTMLLELNWQRWKVVYLLPGRVSRIDKDYEGEVNDDCTVILVPLE